MSRRVLNICREGDSTTSLGSLFQGSVTLRGKKFFLMFRRNFLCLSFCPLSCHWAPLKRAWPHPPDTHPSDFYKHLLGPLAAFSYHPFPFLKAEFLSPVAHWDEKFHHKMVDNRGFMVTRSYTVGVPMMHRTGELQTSCPMSRPAGVMLTAALLPSCPPAASKVVLTHGQQERTKQGVLVLLIQSLYEQRGSMFTTGCLAVRNKS